MNLSINGKPAKMEFSPAATFDDIIRRVSTGQNEPGVAITRVLLNGEDITGSNWDEYSKLEAGQIESVEVFTGNIQQLARDLLDSTTEFNRKLTDELKQSATLFRTGDIQGASQIYARALDGIAVITHTRGLIQRNIGFDAGKTAFRGGVATDVFDRLPGMFDELLAAQEKQDWVLLADLIEFELIPHFESERSILGIWQNSTAKPV